MCLSAGNLGIQIFTTLNICIAIGVTLQPSGDSNHTKMPVCLVGRGTRGIIEAHTRSKNMRFFFRILNVFTKKEYIPRQNVLCMESVFLF